MPERAVVGEDHRGAFVDHALASEWAGEDEHGLYAIDELSGGLSGEDENGIWEVEHYLLFVGWRSADMVLVVRPKATLEIGV